MSDDPGSTRTPSLRALIEQTFDAVEAKDLAAALACFADDATLIDPHYPQPRMLGKAAIGEGLSWAFGMMRSMGFRVERYFEASDGQGAAVEVATSHVLKTGMKLNFPQAFVIDTRDGVITRMQAYEPYGPHGIGGLALALTRLRRRLAAKAT